MDIEIIEHDGKKYIKTSDVENYIKDVVTDVKETQTKINEATSKLEEIEAEELAEQRTEQAKALINKYRLDPSSIDIVSVDSEEAFNESIQFITAAKQSEYGDSSAGFGDVKRPGGNTKQQLYESGRQAYHKARGKA